VAQVSPSADGPSLGDRLSARRAAVPSPARPTRPEAPRESSTTRALGAATGLLATFIAAIAFAFVTSRLIGGTYITFAMPIFVGTLIAALASIGPKRFRFGDRKTLVMMMIGGAVVCWLGQHMLAFLRVIDIVAAQPGLVPTASGAGDAGELALRALENATGESGFAAYLSFVSQGPGAHLSPIGLLGRSEPGVFGTIAIAIGELGLIATAASWSILYRTRQLRRAPAGPLAFFDATTATAASIPLAARKFDELAAIVASAPAGDTHALAIEEGETTAEAVILERDGNGEFTIRKSSRLMPIEAAAGLRRAVAIAIAASPGTAGAGLAVSPAAAGEALAVSPAAAGEALAQADRGGEGTDGTRDP